jgi:hypothetical protein
MMCMTAAEMRDLSGLTFATDAAAEAAILAAQQVAEGYLNRALCKGDRDETFDLCGRRTVLLHAYPVDSLVSVTLDGEEVDGCEMCEMSGILALPRNAAPGERLRVQYIGGFPADAMPMPIKVACALIWRAISHAAENDGQQVVSERLDGYSVTYVTPGQAVSGLDRLAPAAAALLTPYRGKAW